MLTGELLGVRPRAPAQHGDHAQSDGEEIRSTAIQTLSGYDNRFSDAHRGVISMVRPRLVHTYVVPNDPNEPIGGGRQVGFGDFGFFANNFGLAPGPSGTTGGITTCED